ncbi:MAG: hypothetical protein ACJAYQ_003828 [Bacteriovoracaceae bacterium]|jgi:hypothetical protein
MKNLWAWAFSLLLFLSLSLILWKINPQDVFGERAKHKHQVLDTGEKLLVVLIEGLDEAEFSTMLKSGELPNLQSLLNKNSRGIPKGIYMPVEGIISEKEKPNFAPILKGVHPDTQDLSSIPDIYSHLDSYEYYKGSKAEKVALEGFLFDNKPIAEDFTRVLRFLSYVTPQLDYRLETYRTFNESESAFVKSDSGKFFQSYQIFKQRLASKGDVNILPRYSFLNLKSPSLIGNKSGITEEYRDNLKHLDKMLGSVFSLLNKFELDKSLNIMVTSAYSRGSRLVGQNKNKVKVPLIVSGPALNFQSTSQFTDDSVDPIPTSIIHRQSLNLLRIKTEKPKEKGRSIASADDSINFWY